eukprot:s56_g12.t1
MPTSSYFYQNFEAHTIAVDHDPIASSQRHHSSWNHGPGWSLSKLDSALIFGRMPPKLNRQKTIEQQYQKLSQLEHILLRPDSYVGSVEFQKEWQWEGRYCSCLRKRMSSVRPSPKGGDDSEEIDLARPGDESEDEEEEKMDHTGSHFVMLERNRFRKVWTGTVTVADFLGMDPEAWQVWSLFVDTLFCVDCWPQIARRYACGSFIVNVIASLPEAAAGEMVKSLIGGDGTSDTNAHQAARTELGSAKQRARADDIPLT